MFNFENENFNVSRGTLDLKFKKEVKMFHVELFVKREPETKHETFNTFHVEQKNKEVNSENRLKWYPRE